LVLKRERLRHRVEDDSPLAHKIDGQTLKKIADWDSDDPRLLVAEKALQRLVSKQGNQAITLLKAAINSKIQAISDTQRLKAKTPRRANPVDLLIEEIVARNPTISEKNLMVALNAEIGRGIILDIDEESITPSDGNIKEIKVSGLKDRLTRIRKKFAKAG
jgi:hypothetical protein